MLKNTKLSNKFRPLLSCTRNTKYTLLVVSVNYKIFKKVEFPGIPEVILGWRAVTNNFWEDFLAPRFNVCYYHGTSPQKPQSTGSKISFTNIFIYYWCWCQVDFFPCYYNVILTCTYSNLLFTKVKSKKLHLTLQCSALVSPLWQRMLLHQHWGYSPVQLHVNKRIPDLLTEFYRYLL